MEMFTGTVPQEHPMGCAVACVAFRCGMDYSAALTTFSQPEHAWTRGFYCEEIVEALARLGREYAFDRYKSAEHEGLLGVPGTIVFVDPCERYPSGHFMVRDHRGWMNPWSTFPKMIPIEAEFQNSLPGQVGYILFEI